MARARGKEKALYLDDTDQKQHPWYAARHTAQLPVAFRLGIGWAIHVRDFDAAATTHHCRIVTRLGAWWVFAKMAEMSLKVRETTDRSKQEVPTLAFKDMRLTHSAAMAQCPA